MSPIKTKQPLTERSSNLQSPIKSPSKIALPPSPIGSPTVLSKKSSAHVRSFSQDMMEPVIENPMSQDVVNQKPDLVKKIAEAHLTGQTYVSPSDGIFSPTTKKLNEVKTKRFGNSKKTSLFHNSRLLFAKPGSTAETDTSTNDA